MYWTSLYRGYYKKKWDWYFKNSDYLQQVRDILAEIEEFCTKNYRESIEVDKEVDMGVAIDPSIEDLVRMWNGGIYKGYKKESTKKYYLKFCWVNSE